MLTEQPTLQMPPRSPRGRVMAWVTEAVDSGVLSHGSPLPSERILASQLKVSRVTVKAAIDDLIQAGIINPADGGRIRRVIGGPRNRVSQTNGVWAKTIAVFTSFGDGGEPGHNESGWAEVMARGVTEGSLAIGRNALLVHRGQRADLSNQLAGQKLFGLIVTEMIDGFDELSRQLAPLRDAGVPVVVYGGAPELAEYDRVVSDHARGSYELTRWLISQGRRRIVTIWESHAVDRYWVRDRRAGYESAMIEAGLKPLDAIVMPPFPEIDFSRERFDHAVHTVAGYLVPVLSGSESADAFMTLSDRICFGVAAACRIFGKTPGSEVLVAGYDNYWTGSNEGTLEPSVPCATVDKCNREIGRALVALLLDRVQGNLASEPQTRIINPQLVVTKPGATVTCVR